MIFRIYKNFVHFNDVIVVEGLLDLRFSLQVLEKNKKRKDKIKREK